MTRSISLFRFIMLAILIVLAMAVFFVSADTSDSSAEALNVNDDFEVIAGDWLEVYEDFYVYSTITFLPGSKLILPTENSLTVEAGGKVVFTDVDFTYCYGEIIVKGRVEFINCTWLLDDIHITVDGGTLLIQDSQIEDTSNGADAPVVINSGSIDIKTTESAEKISLLVGKGNYAIEAFGGTINKDENSIIRRAISDNENTSSDYESYKKVIYLSQGATFAAGDVYTVYSAAYNVYLTGKNISAESSTIRIITLPLNKTNFDALRTDNGVSIIYAPAVQLSIVNNDGVDGTDGVKTYNKQYMAVTANVANGEYGASYTYKWLKETSGSYDEVLGESGTSLSISNVVQSGKYKCTLYNSGNFVAESSPVTLTIQPQTLTLIWSNTTLEYNATEQKPTATANGLISGDYCMVTVAGGKINAGSYTATATALSNSNYKLPATVSCNYTIEQLEVILAWSDKWFDYDGDYHIPVADITNRILSDAASVSVSGQQKDAGTHTATAASINNANYKLPSNSIQEEFVIYQRTAILMWTDTELTYNGAAQAPEATVNNLIGDDKCAVTVTGTRIYKGDYTATATALSNANYTLPEDKTVEFTIAPKTAELIWTDTDLTYNGAEQKPIATVNNLEDGDTCAVTIDGAQKDKGEYTATVTALSNDNYALPSVVSTSFEITQAEVAIKWSNLSFVYDGKAHAPIAAAYIEFLGEGKLYGEDECEVFVDGIQIEYGSYTATATGLGNVNYKLPESSITADFVINTLTATNFELEHSYTYDGTYQQVIAVCTDIPNDIVYTVFLEGDTTVKDASSYSVRVIGISNPNIALGATPVLLFSVQRRSIEFTVWGNFSVYGDPILANSDLKGSVTSETKEVVLDEAGITLATALAQGDNVGFYDITANWNNKENYTVSFINTAGAYEIKPRVTEVSFGAHDGFVFNNADWFVDVYASNLYSNDVILFTYDTPSLGLAYDGKVSASKAGHYKITFTGIQSNGNYVLKEEKTLAFDIAKIIIGMELSGANGLVYNGLEKSVTPVFTNVLPDVPIDVVYFLYKNGEYTENVLGAGTYKLEVPGFSNGGDYYALPAEGLSETFTVARATIGIVFENYTNLTYSGSPYTVTAIATNVYPDDTVNLVISGNTATYAGGYTATVIGLDNPDYKLPSVGKFINYSIKKAAISVNIDAKSSVYGDPFAALTYTAPASADDLGIVLAKEEGYSAGSYNIMGEWNCNPNYTVSFIGGTDAYTISRRVVEYVIDAASCVYGDEPTPLTATLLSGSLADIASPEIMIATAAAKDAAVGSYAVAASYINANYDITFTNNGELLYTIIQRPVGIYINPQTSVYGDPLKVIGYTVTSGRIIGGDDIGITCKFPDYFEGNVGEYTINAEIANTNYDITVENNGSVLYTVAKRSVVFTIDHVAKIYGEAAVFEGVADNVVSGDDLLITLFSYNTLPGVYDIEGISNNNNYSVTFVNGGGAYTINKKVLSISYSGYTGLEYNGLPHEIAVDIQGIVANDKVDLDIVGNMQISAGNYIIRVKGFLSGDNQNTNYLLPDVKPSQAYTIAPKEVGVEYLSASDVVYSGSPIGATAQPIGYIFGDEVNFDCVIYKFSNGIKKIVSSAADVGRYRLEVKGLSGADKANYLLRQGEGYYIDFEIHPREITYVINDAFSVYGDPLAALSGTVSAETPTWVGDDLGIRLYMEGSKVGNYPITGSADNANYTVSFTIGTYTIAPKPVSLTFSGYQDENGNNRVYKHSSFDIRIGVEGVIAGDDVRYGAEAETFSLKHNGSDINTISREPYYIRVEDNSGDYLLYIGEITGADCDNYVFGGGELAYTVEQRELGIHFEGADNLIYNGTEHTVRVVASNIAVGDEVTLSVEGVTNTNVGIYTASVIGVDNPNYRLPAAASRIYGINKARPIINVSSTWYEFSYKQGTAYSVEASATNGETVLYYLVNGANLTQTTNSFENVGTYTVLLTTAGNNNYLAAEPVEIVIVILATSYSNSLASANSSVSFAYGGDPEALFILRLADNQQQAAYKYKPALRKNYVGYVYEAMLLADNIPLHGMGKTTISMQVPDSYSGQSEVTVMYLHNGAFVETTAAIDSGCITFTLEELGEFALLSDKDLSPRMIDKSGFRKSLAIIGTVGALAVTIAVVGLLRRRRKSSLAAAIDSADISR